MADWTGKLTDLPLSNQTVPRTVRDFGAVITMTAQGAGTQLSSDQDNASSRGIRVTCDISAKTGTIAVVVTIQSKDPASGVYVDRLASASLTSVATTEYIVHPDLAAAANVSAQNFIGQVWRVKVVHGTGTTPSTTGTIGACLLP